MRKKMLPAIVLALVVLMAVPAAGQGLSPTTLEDAGFTCFGDSDETHCMKSQGSTFNVMVFHDGHFIAAETATFRDATKRACPGEAGPGGSHGWGAPFPGAPFTACHHYPAGG